MNKKNKLFQISIAILFLAWILKMQFIFGGDYLFRIGTIGVLISIVSNIVYLNKNVEIDSNGITKIYMVNSICLFIVYTGMMLKVSHIMGSQLEKDFILDFIGIPAIVTSAIYTYKNIHKILETSKSNKIIFHKEIMLPWVLFLFSYLLYNTYSVILTRAS
jgi:hypothetical protein